MPKIARLLMILTLIFAASLSAVRAQEETQDVISTFEGEMTEDEYEFEYTFEAEEGQVIAALFTDVSEGATLTAPTLRLENPAGDVIADSTVNFFSFGNISLFANANSSGTYTLTLGRMDGETGTDVGEFTIDVLAVPFLEAGSVVSGSAASGQRAGYYAVSSDSPWGVSYVKGEGDMNIGVSVNSIDSQAGTLTALASAEGDSLTEATLGVFETEDTYIVTVGEPDSFFGISFSFEDTSADYTIELVSYE
jgi:hypothetical protein